jgi:hypothetical protein
MSMSTRTRASEGAGTRAAVSLATGLGEITALDGRRLLRIVLGGSGSAVTWQRAQIVSLAFQSMPPDQICEVTAADRQTVCRVIESFDRDGFDSLDPAYRTDGV